MKKNIKIKLTSSTDPYCRLLKTSRRNVKSDAGELKERKLSINVVIMRDRYNTELIYF